MSKNVLNNRAIRISLACAPCRSRHLKCNGATPICARCEQEGTTCVWLKSRRGGRPRKVQTDHSEANPDGLDVEPPWTSISTTNVTSHHSSNGSPRSLSNSVSSDYVQSSLIDLYYAYFHNAHPCVLPRAYLEQKIQEQAPGIEPLLLVMQFIGSLYTTKIATEPIEAQVKQILIDNNTATTLYDFQAQLLYAHAVYWRDGYNYGGLALDALVDRAVHQFEIWKKETIMIQSRGDPLIAESWRRTWWLIYCTEMHMAAISHTSTFRTSQKHITPTVELPCEDSEYETGCIPMPRTLEEYENREFDIECGSHFSSFAYFIGLLRALDHYVCGDRSENDVWSRSRCTSADAAVLGWMSLLPKSKRSLILANGKTDEMLWKAHCTISVYVVEIHRPFSNLSYNPVEKVSSCAPPPPPERLDPVEFWDAPCHTKKILTAIERQTDLLTLHSNRIAHSPFSICMIAAATVVHLSACKYVLKGDELGAARERIRAAIGTLETMAEVWQQAKRISWEVKTVAREVLGLGGQNERQSADTQPGPQAANSQLQRSPQVHSPLVAGNTSQTAFGQAANVVPIDWEQFASQMDTFDAAGFAGFEEYWEASFGGSESTFSGGTASDIAVSCN